MSTWRSNGYFEIRADAGQTAIDLHIGRSGMIERHSRAEVQGLRDAVQKTGLIDFLPMPGGMYKVNGGSFAQKPAPTISSSAQDEVRFLAQL
jgi:hypothetical protein